MGLEDPCAFDEAHCVKSSARLLRSVSSRRLVAALAAVGLGTVAMTTAAYAYLAGPLMRAIYSGPAEDLFHLPLIGTASIETLVILLVSVSALRGVAAYGQRLWTASLGQDVIRDL